jgi:copper chaperone
MTASTSHTATYTVTGMTCQHCATSVTEELETVGGVTGVDVQVDTGAVTVTSERPLALDEVSAAVREAGYQLAN